MRLFPYIFNRIAFVRMEFVSGEECRTSVHIWRSRGVRSEAGYGKQIDSATATNAANSEQTGSEISTNAAADAAADSQTADWQAAKGCLVAAIICGHGVVTKPDQAEITARIKADAGTFLWSSSGGLTSFVRREKLQTAADMLSEHNLVAVNTFCADVGTDFHKAATEFAEQIYAGLQWKSLFIPTPESSASAQALVRRATLPVLGLFLLLLTANAVLSPQLNGRRQSLQAELATRERSASGAASADSRQRKLLAEFTARPAVSRSMLCDRIAGAVPERVVLTALEIEPLAKRFEARKPLQRLEGVGIVCGTAPAAADISSFVQRLAELACCRDVRLASVEKQRDGDLLNFRIETKL